MSTPWNEPEGHAARMREVLVSRSKLSEEVADRIINILKCEAIMAGEDITQDDEYAVYLHSNLAVTAIYNMMMEANVFLIPGEKITRHPFTPPQISSYNADDEEDDEPDPDPMDD